MKIKSLNTYKTIVFDCDGVVLNSNKIKTQAFYEATKHYGEKPAQALVDYHVKNGGISRYLKMEYFLKEIIGRDIIQVELDDLLQRFANAVKQGLLSCEVAEGLNLLREKTKNAKWLIVSGGDQSELREIFDKRGLDALFDGGIFGSPDNKDVILSRELSNQTILSPALFIGDSKYDYEAANRASLDFIFLSNWTEVQDYESWCEEKSISYATDIKFLCS